MKHRVRVVVLKHSRIFDSLVALRQQVTTMTESIYFACCEYFAFCHEVRDIRHEDLLESMFRFFLDQKQKNQKNVKRKKKKENYNFSFHQGDNKIPVRARTELLEKTTKS
jgi:hypothetical protein